jgi:hypothetical protein
MKIYLLYKLYRNNRNKKTYMTTNTAFIRIDENTIINLNYTQWIKQIDDCMYLCNKVYGCDEKTLYGTHKICKTGNNSVSYTKLEKIYTKL